MHKIIQGWAGKKVLCIGDCCHDRWQYGIVNRNSPEAPVQVLDQEERSHASDGMAGLVANMVRCLGGQATMISTPHTRWQTKTRIMGRVPGRSYQQLLRVDTPLPKAINDSEADDLLERSQEALDGCNAILLCDYAKGVCTPYLCRELRKLAGGFRVPIAVDPGRGVDWEKSYSGMIIKANQHEWAESGYVCPLQCVGELELDALIVTRGSNGTDLTTRSCDQMTIPVDPIEGVDVCGAGDQCHAVLGLCLASHVQLDQACRLANIAGRLQVLRHGCEPVTAIELQAELAKQVTSTVAA